MSWLSLYTSRALRGAHSFVPKGRHPEPSNRLWWEKSVFAEGEVTETISPYRLQHLPGLLENVQHRVVEPLRELAWALPVFLPLYYLQTVSMHALEKRYEYEGDPHLIADE